MAINSKTFTLFNLKGVSLMFTVYLRLRSLSARQKIFYGFLTIGGKWLWTRFQSLSIVRRESTSQNSQTNITSSRIWKAITWTEKIYKVAMLLNFLTFLFNGKYVSLAARLAGLRLVFRVASMKRTVSFEFMNRQLVW